MTSVATRIDLLTGKPAGLPGTAPAPSTCSTDLSANPWDFAPAVSAGYGPGASEDDVVPAGAPARFHHITEDLRVLVVFSPPEP